MMKINSVVVGPLEENCYLLEQGEELLIVDPGDEANKIIDVIGKRKVHAILITHRHFDHVGALEDLVSKYHVPVYDRASLEEKQYQIGPFKFQVMFTPGHSSDSVTYYFEEEKVMMVGDFVFYRSIGRTDLETGSMKEMQKSIERLKQYPDDTTLYPGHGPRTLLGSEKRENLYF